MAVHFKGKGFYNTDYGTKRRNRELEKSGKDGADKTAAKAKDVRLRLRLGLRVRLVGGRVVKSASSDKPAAKKTD